jgi:transposase InsO family protein
VSKVTAVGTSGSLHDVMCVPAARQPLFSVGSYLDQFGGAVVFRGADVIHQCGSRITTLGIRTEDGLYTSTVPLALVPAPFASASPATSITEDSVSFQLRRERVWDLHRCFAHLGREPLRRLLASSAGLRRTSKLRPRDVRLLGNCPSCQLGKSKRHPRIKVSSSRATHFGQRLCADLAGPIRTATIGGGVYAFVVIDDFSGFIWTTIIKKKTQVPDVLAQLIEVTLHQRGDHQVEVLRTDNGTEVLNQRVTDLLRKHDIRRERTCVYTSHQNGKAERAIGTLFASLRTCLSESRLPARFWGEAIAYCTYSHNRLPCSSNPNFKSPFEIVHSEPPRIHHLRPFGCGCAVNTPLKLRRNKTQPSAVPGISTGYGYVDGKKGYRVWVPSLRRVVTSFDVVFNDLTSSIHTRSSTFPDLVVLGSEMTTTLLDLSTAIGASPDSNTPSPSISDMHLVPLTSAGAEGDTSVNSSSTPDLHLPVTPNDTPDATHDEDDTPATTADADDVFNRVWGDGFDNNNPANDNDAVSSRTRSNSPDLVVPVFDTAVAVNDTSPTFASAYSSTASKLASAHATPRSYREALSSPDSTKWLAAIKEELNAVASAGVYHLVDKSSLPTDANIIGFTWVFKIKVNADGTIERYKARITAKGCSQKSGVDFQESGIFAPVASATTIRLVIYCIVQRGLLGRSFDIKTAFLYGTLSADERVYMRIPDGADSPPGKCWSLQRCLYGLKQSARRFNEHLHKSLISIDFTQSINDPCLYHSITAESYTLVVIVVDDVLMATTSDALGDKFLESMRKIYSMKDLGRPTYTVGTHFERDPSGNYTISQKRYISDLINKYATNTLPVTSLPMDPSLRLCPSGSTTSPVDSPDFDPTRYRSLIGSLMYTLLTRPDVAAPVSMLARFMSAPKLFHWECGLRVLGYLKSTLDLCLTYTRSATPPKLVCYVDSDWASDAETRRSRYGYAIYLGQALISWRSKLHSSIALSTAEAEYIGASQAAKEILWLRQLLADIGFPQSEPTVVFEDNAACIKMATNHGVSARNKHLEVKMHFVRELVSDGVIKLVKIGTNSQRVDLFTKNLARPAFEQHRATLLNGTGPDFVSM